MKELYFIGIWWVPAAATINLISFIWAGSETWHTALSESIIYGLSMCSWASLCGLAEQWLLRKAKCGGDMTCVLLFCLLIFYHQLPYLSQAVTIRSFPVQLHPWPCFLLSPPMIVGRAEMDFYCFESKGLDTSQCKPQNQNINLNIGDHRSQGQGTDFPAVYINLREPCSVCVRRKCSLPKRPSKAEGIVADIAEALS